MIRRLILCAIIAGPAGLATIPLAAQDAPTAVEIGERRSLHSDVLGEDRAYWVYLPASYADERYAPQTYPVMYLLDGAEHFHSATGVVQFMSTGINGNMQAPEMIVVAIPNTNRTRDLTPTHSATGPDGEEAPALAESGGGDEFLRFMREELFPEIDSTYRTRPWRLFVGHSFGGLLALHAAVHHPDMFQSYIAIDPSLWWDDQRLLGQAQTYFTETEGLEGSIFVTLANNPSFEPGGPKVMEQAGRAFGWAMEAAASDHFRPGIKYYSGEDHGSVPLISLYEGLLHTFDGYKAPLLAFLENPAALGDHFAALSEKLGMELLPPEPIVNQLGYAMLQEDTEAAIGFFKLNVESYPESANAHDSLGDGYAAAGQTDLAIESFERSLELNPDNEHARERLAELRSGG